MARKADAGASTSAGEADAEAAPSAREIDDSRRALHDMLRFPSACRDRRCKRARRCAGDVAACARRFFPHVPARIKAWLHHVEDLREAGLSPVAAARAAEARLVAHDKAEAARARHDGDAVAPGAIDAHERD
ncbi:MAG: hypothetical protein HY056_17855 [Proteobacteria bacterium]|nr:hypothetical protein [Pseudomonadota bacterium]